MGWTIIEVPLKVVISVFGEIFVATSLTLVKEGSRTWTQLQ